VVAPLQQHADLVLAGHWGDVWLDDMGLLHQDGPDLLAVVRHKLEKKGRGWLLSHFGLLSQVERLEQQVAAELENYAHLADLDFRVKAFKTDQWSWRWTTASLRMFQAAVVPRLPFYDNRLVDFFGTVPTEFVAGRRLQIDYLKRFAPDLARIAWQPYQANLYRYRHFNTWLLPARAWRKARRILSGREGIARNFPITRNWEVQFFQENGRQQLYNALLAPAGRLHEFIPAPAVRELLDSFYQQPNGQIGYTVSMLFTFAAWLERYG
jgi:hypothetical protein